MAKSESGFKFLCTILRILYKVPEKKMSFLSFIEEGTPLSKEQTTDLLSDWVLFSGKTGHNKKNREQLEALLNQYYGCLLYTSIPAAFEIDDFADIKQKENTKDEPADEKKEDLPDSKTDPYDKNPADSISEKEKTDIQPKTDEPIFPALPLPKPAYDYKNNISIFAFSQQGQSHLGNMQPCQDRCAFRIVGKSLILAAVADGVGSCALSD